MKQYKDFTLDELLTELHYLGGALVSDHPAVVKLKAEIKKRFALLEAHRNKGG